MYNQPYFIPSYYGAAPSMMRGGMMHGAMNNAMNGARLATQGAGRGIGLFSRLGNSIQAIKRINWGGLITNTSKTLSVVNQAIPLVRQVGPMVNNVKSMLRVASIFKDETDNKPLKKNSGTTNLDSNIEKVSSNNTNNYVSKINEDKQIIYDSYEGAPTFFVSS